jgi:hypothetical protein
MPARIHLAIQTSLQESVVGEERDNGGARCSMCLYSTCHNLKLSTNILETLFGCVLARILSYTLSDAYQHALGHAWCVCVPARIHLAIPTSLQESVVGEERDDGGARSSMCSYSTCLNLKLSTNILVTLFGCCLHTYCPTLCLMRASTPSAMLGAYACQHAFSWQSRQPPIEGGWRGMGRWGSALQHVFILHLPQSQAINEYTVNIVRMRACTHTVLHSARCVPARPWPCLVHIRASTHSVGNPDKPPRECGWRGAGRWGSALQHVFILHLPQSQAINKYTGNTVRMRAGTHTVLHFVRCMPARPAIMRGVCVLASTHLRRP